MAHFVIPPSWVSPGGYVVQGEPTWRGRSLALVRGSVLGTVVELAAITAGWLSGPAGAGGILPPDNPPANIAPSSPDFLTSIDPARA